MEALKAENLRLLEENTELKRILAQHQASSVEDISMDLQPLHVHYSDSNDDDLVAMDSKSLSKLIVPRAKKQKMSQE